MNAESIILSAVGTVLTILIGVVSFFLKGVMNKIDILGKDLQEMKLTFQQSSGKIEMLNASCQWKHGTLDKKIEEIEKTCRDLKSDIDKIKE